VKVNYNLLCYTVFNAAVLHDYLYTLYSYGVKIKSSLIGYLTCEYFCTDREDICVFLFSFLSWLAVSYTEQMQGHTSAALESGLTQKQEAIIVTAHQLHVLQ
jgi:hypothetical protein